MNYSKVTFEIEVDNIDHFIKNLEFYFSKTSNNLNVKKSQDEFKLKSSFGELSSIMIIGKYKYISRVFLVKIELLPRVLMIFRPLIITLLAGPITMNFSVYWLVFVLIGLVYSIFKAIKASNKIDLIEDVITNLVKSS